MTLTIERLKEIYRYDPVSGLFFRVKKFRARRPLDTPIGSLNKVTGYLSVMIDGHRYYLHRLAFLWMTGEIPSEVDHEDRNKTNNIWSNLRKATHSQNHGNRVAQRGSTSGFKGVTWDKARNKWSAKIMVRGKIMNLGRFDAPEEAHAVYAAVAKKHFGEFARTA